MEARAQARYVRVTPMKARRVIDLIRGMNADDAQALLRFAPQAASEPVGKVLASAVANAGNNHGMDTKDLTISEAFVDEGPTMKRIRPRAQGRAFKIRKRSSHITVIVTDGIALPKVTRPTKPAKAVAAKSQSAPKSDVVDKGVQTEETDAPQLKRLRPRRLLPRRLLPRLLHQRRLRPRRLLPRRLLPRLLHQRRLLPRRPLRIRPLRRRANPWVKKLIHMAFA